MRIFILLISLSFLAGTARAAEPCCRPQPCRPILFPRLHALIHGCPAPVVIVECQPVPVVSPAPVERKRLVYELDESLLMPGMKEARKLFDESKFEACKRALKKAVENDREHLLRPAEVIIASWLYDAGKESDARHFLETFIAGNPVHPDGYICNSKMALREGRITDAVLSGYAAQNFSNQPMFNTDQQWRMRSEARFQLVEAFAIRGDYQSAIGPLTAFLEDKPSSEDYKKKLLAARFENSEWLERRGYESLLAKMQLIVREDPLNPELKKQLRNARIRLIEFLESRGKYADTVEPLLILVREEPANEDFKKKLRFAKSTLGISTPIEWRLFDAASKYEWKEFAAARTLFVEKKYYTCWALLNEAFEKGAGKVPPPEIVMAMWVHLAADREADGWVDAFFDAHRGESEPFLLLAEIAVLNGNLDKAIYAFHRAINISTDGKNASGQRYRIRYNARLGLIAVCEFRGDYAGMIEPLQELLNDDPGDKAIADKLKAAKKKSLEKK